jgi:hypothetical protein
MPLDYARAFARVPFARLHEMSFIDVSFSLTTHAYGYVTGEFSAHSLIQASILAGANPAPTAHEAERLHIWDHLVNNNMLYQDFVPLLSRGPHHAIELPRETWEHIATNARHRDPVTDRHEENIRMPASLDVFSTPTRHADNLSASVGAVARMADGRDPEDITNAESDCADLLCRTMHAYVHGRRESIEHLLLPFLYPAEDGFYRIRAGVRFSASEYLKHRC